MRIAYLECFSGVSGDMFLGALLHAGVSEDLLRDTVRKLDLGAELRISRVDRSGVSATKVDVLVAGVPAEGADASRRAHDGTSASDHEHSHSHSDSHGDHAQEGHSHDHTHQGHTNHHGRSLNAIRQIIKRTNLPEAADRTAIRAFELLAEAEAKIHNVPMEAIHFHEVGAVDAIVDVVCTAVGCDSLNVDRWISSPINVGGGTVQCAHGVFPVPAPASLELLRGFPTYSSGASVELATPTGAALVRALGCESGAFPAVQIASVGYGAGSRNLKGSPNVLRLSVGESIDAPAGHAGESVTVLETTLDDLSPQVLGYVSERLLQAGALDVFIIAAQMKKNRPGSLVTVLCDAGHAKSLRELLFAETTTLGIRTREEHRATLDRRIVTVQTAWGNVRLKEASINGRVTNYSPEYEDCRCIAEARSIPLREVQQAAIQSYLATKPASAERNS